MDMLNPFQDPESFKMQQTLWSIVRSPLIYGGDPRELSADHPHVKVMTNAGVLQIADKSRSGAQLWYNAQSAAYVADAADGSGDK